MRAWQTFVDGKVRSFEELQVSRHETEAEGRAAAEAKGAHLVGEKMVGALYYNSETRESFRVSALGWAPGFVLFGTREVTR
jgi:hypothetical protein